MRRGMCVLVLSGAFALIGSSAFALGNATVHASKDSGGNWTVTVDKTISKCTYPPKGPVRTFCYTFTNDEYLLVGPYGIIWTPSHTEYFYDNVTGKHFLGEDPGTLDQPL